MSPSTYTPLPGTIPARVIAHLKTLPAGSELPTAALCEEIGQTATSGFGACVARALQAGLMAVRKAPDSGLLYWSLGDGEPQAPATQDIQEPEDAPSPAPATAAGLMSAWRPVRSVFDLGNASSEVEKPEVAQEPAAIEVPRFLPEEAEPIACTPHDDTDEPFVCALWSDGRLQMQRGNAEMLLTVHETRALLHYLDTVAVAQ